MTRMLLSSEHTLQEMEQAGSISAVRCVVPNPHNEIPINGVGVTVDFIAKAFLLQSCSWSKHGLLSIQGCENDSNPDVQVCVRA